MRLRFKNFMRERTELSKFGEETLLSVSEYYGVKPRSEVLAGDAFESRAESLVGYRRVYPGDFVMNYMLAWKGAYGISEYDGIASPAYSVFAMDDSQVDRRFVHHLLQSKHMHAVFRSRSKGIIESRLRLYPDAFLALNVEIPDIETQKRIADFLAHETARIDQLVERKQRVVDLLGEKRQAICSNAVTRGLDPNVPMRPTDSPFVPLLPAHWSLPRLKQLATVRGGITLGRKLPEGVDTIEVPYLRVANVQAGWVDLSEVTTLEVLPEELKRYRLKTGDVLMNEGGDNDKLGRGVVWEAQIDPCMHQNHVFAARPKEPGLSEWIALCSNATHGRDYFFLNCKQTTNLASIAKSKVEQFPIPLPPEAERQAIVEFVHRKIRASKEVERRVQDSIDRLHELRSALITSAVTGEIDVEDWRKSGGIDRWMDDATQEEADV